MSNTGEVVEHKLPAQTADEGDDILDSCSLVDEPHSPKPALWLPAFLVGDFAVVVLCVASIVCLVGLTRQLMLLWEASQLQGRMLERAARAVL